jgi:hypothetical protein
MSTQIIPSQAAAQQFEQMTSISTKKVKSFSSEPDATIEHILKSPTHTLLAPWRTSTSNSSESTLSQEKLLALCIILVFITLFVISGIFFLIRFYYKRLQRARAEAEARAAIADEEFFPKDVGLDCEEPAEKISDYKRSNIPAGLEWQIKAMREGVLTRKSARSRLASFKRRREDCICSVPDYYFTASPTEPEVETTPEPAPRKSLDSSIDKEKKKITRSPFDCSHLAGQTIGGKSLFPSVI